MTEGTPTPDRYRDLIRFQLEAARYPEAMRNHGLRCTIYLIPFGFRVLVESDTHCDLRHIAWDDMAKVAVSNVERPYVNPIAAAMWACAENLQPGCWRKVLATLEENAKQRRAANTLEREIEK